ncbi:hypothetical protein XENORESO_021977 [Xenotaenia resolanae]|uniref:Secreted protein n=1 Tax=Xenotaenia resolanae TaxID=208358 RepID=A0ABV0WPU9_9TELE
MLSIKVFCFFSCSSPFSVQPKACTVKHTRFIPARWPVCFQNLLLGGPVIVVLEKHSPRLCRLFSPAEDVLLGRGMRLHEGNRCSKHFAVFTVDMIETKYSVQVK